MTASIFDPARQRAIDEGYRLHMAIVQWGARHGVRAYRVLTPSEAWFEILDPNERRIVDAYPKSEGDRARYPTDVFPEKIRRAIDAHQADLLAYADWSREQDARRNPSEGSTDPRPVRFCCDEPRKNI